MKTSNSLLIISSFIVALIGGAFFYLEINHQKNVYDLKVKNAALERRLGKMAQELSSQKNTDKSISSPKVQQQKSEPEITKKDKEILNGCLKIKKGRLPNTTKALKNKQYHCLSYFVGNEKKTLLVRACNKKRSHEWAYVLSDKLNICTSRKEIQEQKKGYVHFDKKGRLHKPLRQFVYSQNKSQYYVVKKQLAYACPRGYKGNYYQYGWGVCRPKNITVSLR